MSPRGVFLACATMAVCMAAVASPASAGEFEIRSCMADTSGLSTAAFAGYRTRGMAIRRDCNFFSGRRVKTGLLTTNSISRVRARRTARSYVMLDPPPGTAFKSFRWSGNFRRADCGWALELYYRDRNGTARAMDQIPAGRDCPKPRGAQAAARKTTEFNIYGARRIVQRVICRGYAGQKSCSRRGRNYIQTLYAKAVVVDVQRPSLQITGGGLASGRWVRGHQAVNFTASDQSGIAASQIDVAGIRVRNPLPCNHARRVPCSSGPGRLPVDTRQAGAGPRPYVVRVWDPGGMEASRSGLALIDNTAPPRVNAAVEGGTAWRRSNAYAVSWQAPGEAHAPIVAAHYRLCRTGGRPCVSGTRRGRGLNRLDGLTVPGPGSWELTSWREDEAGNQDPRLGSVAVPLRFDPEPPTLRFEPIDPGDPARLVASIHDAVSGPAGGQLEISRTGTSTWHTLPTQRERDRLVARVDDSRLPAGNYLVRAHGTDTAGNAALIDRRPDGAPMVITLPARASARLRAGVLERRGARRRGGRGQTVVADRARVRPGRTVRVGGRLTLRGGKGLAGVAVAIFGQTEGETPRFLGVAVTDGRGRFRRAVRVPHSMTVGFWFSGSRVVQPVADRATIAVPARTALSLSRRRVLNGGRVSFTGRVPTDHLPPGGKLVEMQVRLSGRWQTFRTARSAPNGRWRIGYRFRRTRGLQRYRFRARVPKEAGYPFGAYRSPARTVTVRGR